MAKPACPDDSLDHLHFWHDHRIGTFWLVRPLRVSTVTKRHAAHQSLIERALFFIPFLFTMDELLLFVFVSLPSGSAMMFSSEAVIEGKRLHTTMDDGK